MSISSRLTSSSTTSVSSTTSLRILTSSLTTGRFSTTTSSSVTGTLTSSSPISVSEASPSTGTRSTVTSSRLVGTSILSRSVRTLFRTPTSPTSRSRVPALSSSSVLCTRSSSSRSVVLSALSLRSSPATVLSTSLVGRCQVVSTISLDRKSTRLNSSQRQYLVCRLLLEKKKK